jgi:hypothetical protein
MPARSQQQAKFIWAMRNKYGSKKKSPKNMKWVFDKEWTKGVDIKSLPKYSESKSVMRFEEFNEKYEFEDFTLSDMEFVKELYEEGITDIGQLSIESDLSKETVKQIISTLKKRGEINL